MKLVLGDGEPELIGSVNHENDGFRLCVVVFPESAVTTLARHVENGEVNFRALEGLYLEADGGRKFLLTILLRL